MSTDSQSERHGHHDGFAEFTEELRLLAEVLLARVEPVLRRTAADGQADLGGCAWCPVCAAAALVRGDHHDVVAALADHGTSMVTVLREALAGIPVEPVLPPEWADHGEEHQNSTGTRADAAPGRAPYPTEPDATTAGQPPHATAPAGHDPGSAAPGGPRRRTTAAHPDAGTRTRRGASGQDTAVPRPRRVDEFAAPRTSSRTPHIAPDTGPAEATAPVTGGGAFTATPTPAEPPRPAEGRSTARAPRSQYVDIPVTIRG